jgi:hypothetical protein
MANFLLAYLLLLLLGICMNPSINPISCTLPWKNGWEIVSSEIVVVVVVVVQEILVSCTKCVITM